MFKSRMMRGAGNISRMRGKRNTYRSFVGEPEGKRQLGRRTNRWQDNVENRFQKNRTGQYELDISGSVDYSGHVT
jgi:hypothetical protein